MIIPVEDLQITMIDAGDRQCIHIAKGDGFEPDSLKAWAALVKPGMVALDVGAYTGLYSIVAALRGAKAVALEPMPANRWRLGINADINEVFVMVHQVAASDHNGPMRLNYSRHTPLTTGGSLEGGIEGHTDSIEVSAVTIDSLNLADVAAIKIDVELHELFVLQGAMSTISKFRPPLLIETLNDNMRRDIMRMLPRYEVAAILDRRNTLFTPNRRS